MVLENNDLVSVVIPTYKRAKKLSRAINSVLDQTYKKIEVIVVDDNSDSDDYRRDTELLMKNFSKNPRVTYLKHSINRNGSAARNTGIKYSNAKYIAFLDDDDYFLNTKIENQVALLEQHLDTKFGGVCCNRIAMYNDCIYDKNDIKINTDGNYLDTLLNKENILAAGSTLIVRSSVFDKIGYFDETFKRHQDYEFLIRFFREFKMLILSENLACICVDGARNYPNASIFHSIKLNFFEKFNSDIMKLSIEKRKKIYYNQWSEVFLYYLVEYNFTKAKEIYFHKMEMHKSNNNFLFIIKCIYLIVEKKILFLQALKYKIFSLKYILKK
jgi:glycosyltransferase involved in cell wall biosynthesis